MNELMDLEGGGGGGSSGSVEQYHKELRIEISEDIPEHKSECSIYRVPKYLRKVNEEAYTPHVISIGPLHHGKPEFAYMERQKIRYKTEFQDRITMANQSAPDKWEELVRYVRENAQSIYNCYAEILNFKNDEDFVSMILLDAVFIIEYLLRRFLSDRNDHLVGTQWRERAIRIDLHLLENQLPYYVLEGLYSLAFGIRDGGVSPVPFLYLCCHYFAHSSAFFEIPDGVKIKHFTDLTRHGLVKPSLKEKAEGSIGSLPSAIKLHELGLKFKAIKESKSSFDIKFKKTKQLVPFFKVHELHMPCFFIRDYTESFFRNIMALEQCHYPSETHFCNYINLLDKLINTERDVDLLIAKGILNYEMGDHTVAAEMVNKLCQNMVHSRSCLFHVAKDLKNHYNNPWYHAQATLLNVYFCNPWRSIATVAAIILLLLTLIQSICSVISLL